MASGLRSSLPILQECRTVEASFPGWRHVPHLLAADSFKDCHGSLQHRTYRDLSTEWPGRASSRSFTTKIAEVENAGTRSEKELPLGVDGGYLWRLNSYWRFREQDGGVIVECESISLSRSIPFGLGWLIGRYIESVPKESLEDTLTSIRDGVVHSR